MCCLVACCAVYFMRCHRNEEKGGDAAALEGNAPHVPPDTGGIGGERYVLSADADVEAPPSSAIAKLEEAAALYAVAHKPVTPPPPEGDVWEGLIDDSEVAAEHVGSPVATAGKSGTDAFLPIAIIPLQPHEQGKIPVDAVAQDERDSDGGAPELELTNMRSERSHASAVAIDRQFHSSSDGVSFAPLPSSETLYRPEDPSLSSLPAERGPAWLPGWRKLVAETLASPVESDASRSGMLPPFRSAREAGPRPGVAMVRRAASTRVAPGRRQAPTTSELAGGLEALPPLPFSGEFGGALTDPAGHPHEVAEDIQGAAPAAPAVESVAAQAVFSGLPDAAAAAATSAPPTRDGGYSFASYAASASVAPAPPVGLSHAASPPKLPLQAIVAAEKLVADLIRVRAA